MSGSIKIDDGSGNYTILTNAGSLGSDKTLTIPNETATLATTNGITEIDTWALTATVNSNGDITSNLARYNGTNSGYKGTGMTQSSGVFTFPSTGFWQITCGIHGQVGSDDGVGIAVKATDKDENPYVIGGGQIYNLAMKYCDVIELTRVHDEFEADTFFPKIKENEWILINEEKHKKDERHKYSFTYKTYLKIK